MCHSLFRWTLLKLALDNSASENVTRPENLSLHVLGSDASFEGQSEEFEHGVGVGVVVADADDDALSLKARGELFH